MTCIQSCLVSSMLFFSILATMFASKVSPSHKNFQEMFAKAKQEKNQILTQLKFGRKRAMHKLM